VLYKKGLSEEKTKKRLKILDLILDLHLTDFAEIIPLLKTDNFEAHKSSIQILKGDKLNYDKNDITNIDEIINIISTTFHERGQYSQKKKGLTGKEKEIWICECDKENAMDKKYCSNCGSDIFGFKEHAKTPSAIAEKLISDLEILKNNLAY